MRAERWSVAVFQRILALALVVIAAEGGAVASVRGVTPAANPQEGCDDPRVHCVGPAASFEYRDIQHAVDAVAPGHVVWVAAGEYSGFRVRRGGTAERPVRIAAAAGVVISGPEPFGQESIYLENVSWVVLEGFVVEQAGRAGNGIAAHDATADQPMRGLVIRNNTVRDARISNIYMSQVADSVIEGNIVSGAREEHGIYLSNAGSDNTVLRGNSCFGNARNGIHFNGDARYGGDGVHTGLVVDGNILYDNQANGLDVDGVRASSFVNNVVFNNGRHGLRAFAIDAAAGPADLVIANNTFVGNGGWAIKLTQDDGGHTLFNNILLSVAGSIVVGSRRFVSDHNVAPGPFSVDTEHTVVSLPEWQSLGFDRSSLVASRDVLFVAPGSGDFRLAPGSPAAAAGVAAFHAIAAPAADLAGMPRPAQGPSIGALVATPVPAQRRR